MFLNTIMYEYL